MSEAVFKACTHFGSTLVAYQLSANASPLDQLSTANSPFAPYDPQAERRKLTVSESIARNKVRFAKTLEALS